MKDTKRKLEFFAPYDYDGMTDIQKTIIAEKLNCI